MPQHWVSTPENQAIKTSIPNTFLWEIFKTVGNLAPYSINAAYQYRRLAEYCGFVLEATSDPPPPPPLANPDLIEKGRGRRLRRKHV